MSAPGRTRPISCRKLQKELIDVVARYVAIREDMIRVNLGKTGETSLLEINIELDGAKPLPAAARGGLAGAATASPPAKSG